MGRERGQEGRKCDIGKREGRSTWREGEEGKSRGVDPHIIPSATFGTCEMLRGLGQDYVVCS